MKFLCILFCLLFCFASPNLNVNCNSTAKINDSEREVYNADIQHIFIHSLIAYPEILAEKPTKVIDTYRKDCLDYIEFNNLLNELYKNNFVLVNINKTYRVDENGNVSKTKVLVPKGKKPLVISVDDVVYDPKKSGNGMVDKLIVKDERIATSTKVNGKDDISFDREFAPILENFINNHKDFSVDNARATINLTGFCGILGYRINSKNKITAKSESENAKIVVNKLKSLGYNFACHSYSHFHINRISENILEQDLKNFQNIIEPIIGKTDIFVYPYGEWDITTNGELSPKQKILNNYGYKLFLGVGMKNFYGFYPYESENNNKILLWDRKNIDGYSLTHHQKYLASLFDCAKIISIYSKQR